MHPTFLKQNHVTAKLKAVLTQSVCYTKPVSITLMHWDTKWEEMFERKRYENYSLEKVQIMSSASHPSLTPPPLPATAPPVTCVSPRITLPALGQLSHHTHPPMPAVHAIERFSTYALCGWTFASRHLIVSIALLWQAGPLPYTPDKKKIVNLQTKQPASSKRDKSLMPLL